MSIKKDLVSLANHLDRLGLVGEADLLDRLLPKVAAFLPWDGVEEYEEYEKREGPKRDADGAERDKFRKMLSEGQGMASKERVNHYATVLSMAQKEGEKNNNETLTEWVDDLIGDYSKAANSEEDAFVGGSTLERLLSYPEYQGFSAEDFKQIVVLFFTFSRFGRT